MNTTVSRPGIGLLSLERGPGGLAVWSPTECARRCPSRGLITGHGECTSDPQ
jgi:hypothetical protein